MILILVLFMSNHVNAKAWLPTAKHGSITQKLFYPQTFSFSQDYYDHSADPFDNLPNRAVHSIIKQTSKGYELEGEQGISKFLSASFKLFFSEIEDDLQLSIANEKQEIVEAFRMKYQKIAPELHLNRALSIKSPAAMSASLIYSPGEYVIAGSQSSHLKKMQYLGLQSAYGSSLSNNHYYEIMMGTKYFPQLGNAQWDLNLKYGFSFLKVMNMELGMFNSFRRPYVKHFPYTQILADHAFKVSGYKPIYREFVYDLLSGARRYNLSLLGSTLSYRFRKAHTIGLQGLLHLKASGQSNCSNFLIFYRKDF